MQVYRGCTFHYDRLYYLAGIFAVLPPPAIIDTWEQQTLKIQDIIAQIFRFGIHILGFAKTWIELENFLVCSFWWQKSETNIYFRPDSIGQSSEVFEALHTIIN